jgi:L-lactate dehydrogenase complex protein LldG
VTAPGAATPAAQDGDPAPTGGGAGALAEGNGGTLPPTASPGEGDAKAAVLSRIRAALGSPPPAPPTVPRDYRTAGEHGPGSSPLLDLLTDRLEDYRATVHRCGATDVSEVIAERLAALGVRRLALPPGVPLQWLTAWLAAAEETEDGVRALPDGEPALGTQELDEVDAVLTGCAVAVADTGTIVLDGSPDQGRRALTLVPDRHVVVVRADQVVQTVPEALRRLDPRRPLTFVSGPSATSDIELQRVEGVHGPRTLVVVLIG